MRWEVGISNPGRRNIFRFQNCLSAFLQWLCSSHAEQIRVGNVRGHQFWSSLLWNGSVSNLDISWVNLTVWMKESCHVFVERFMLKADGAVCRTAQSTLKMPHHSYKRKKIKAASNSKEGSSRSSGTNQRKIDAKCVGRKIWVYWYVYRVIGRINPWRDGYQTGFVSRPLIYEPSSLTHGRYLSAANVTLHQSKLQFHNISVTLSY